MLKLQLRKSDNGLFIFLLGEPAEIEKLNPHTLALAGTRYTLHNWHPLESCNYSIRLTPKHLEGTLAPGADMRVLLDFLTRNQGTGERQDYTFEDLTAQDTEAQKRNTPKCVETRETHVLRVHKEAFTGMASRPKYGRLVKSPNTIGCGDFLVVYEYYCLWRFLRIPTGRVILGQVVDIKLQGAGIPRGHELLQVVNFSHPDIYCQVIGV